MAIGTGDTLPEAKLAKMGADGPEVVDVNALAEGKKLAIFALPEIWLEGPDFQRKMKVPRRHKWNNSGYLV